MEYYSVMLVDDEEEVRQAIIKRINWESIGFKLVDSAENGEEALEKAERICPDVVMTDIQMPFMDGLTFCKKLRESMCNTKIVIFSGYDEFEYAKEAIKLEAEEYILKPINAAELEQVFMRIKERLDEEMDQKRSVERLEKYYFESIPMLKEQFLVSLLEGKIAENRIDELMHLYEYNLNAPFYAVGVIHGDAVVKTPEKEVFIQTNLLPVSLKQIVDENMQKLFEYRSVNYLGTIVVIVMLKEISKLSSFIRTMDKICKLANKMLEVNISAGIGRVYTKLSDISSSFEEAQHAIDYRILLESNQAIYIQDIEPKAEKIFFINEKEIQDVVKEIKVGSKEELEKAVIDLVEKMKSSRISMTQFQSAIMEIMVEMVQLSRAYQLDVEEIEKLNFNFYSEIKKFDTLDAFGAWLLEICMKLRGSIRKERTDTTKLLIEQAKNYIMNHYADSELSVEKVCNHLNLSATYFSTLFKKEIGMSFVTYLTQIRMEQALRLLNTTEEKAYVISEIVGYVEPNYFSYVFKKQYGISPSKYRANREE